MGKSAADVIKIIFEQVEQWVAARKIEKRTNVRMNIFHRYPCSYQIAQRVGGRANAVAAVFQIS